ncbi:MAG TPA: hypothetical protein VEL69_04525, partial [Ktedonobacteraceae bacterium]|nr:hypothetical protein [Ktedonobacteraceae bacterium]
MQHLTDAHQVNGRRDGFGLQPRLCLSSIACAAQTMTANAFGNRAFDACPQTIALLKGSGGLFGTAVRARLMNGLRRKGYNPAFVLLPLGSQLFDGTSLTGDRRKAHPDHLLAAIVSSGAPVLREVPLGTAHLLLVPIHLERTHTIARFVLPSALLFERAYQLDAQFGVFSEHFTT